MIDVSVYGLTEEQARMLLSNTGLLGLFYTIGVITASVYVIYYIFKGVLYIRKYIKKRKENKAVNG